MNADIADVFGEQAGETDYSGVVGKALADESDYSDLVGE
jgi:hypothetical protein